MWSALQFISKCSISMLKSKQVVDCAARTSSYSSVIGLTDAIKNNEPVDDPDEFGSLSRNAGKYKKCESLSGQYISKEDEAEDKYLSFTATDRKSTDAFKREIKQLVHKNQLKDALRLLEIEMKEDKVKPSKDIFTILIGGCGRAGYTKKAFTLYNDMKKKGFTPNPSTYTALFNACSNSPWVEDGLERSLKLREQITSKGMVLNRIQYHGMLKAFARFGDFATVLQITEEMSAKDIPPNTETYNFILQACVSLPEEGFHYALIIWRKMRQSKIQPNIFSYNLLLRIVRDCGVGKEFTSEPIHPLRLLECTDPKTSVYLPKPSELLVQSADSQLPTTTLNMLGDVVTCSNSLTIKDLDKCENRLALLGGMPNLMKEMKKDGAKADIKTFTLLLHTIEPTKQHEEDLVKFLDKFCQKFQVAADVDFFNILIKKRSFRGDYAGAKEVLTMIQERKLHPNIMTFGVLAMGCHTKNTATRLIEDMENAGFRMNIQIFGSLLGNAICSRNCINIIDLMNRAIDYNLEMNEKVLKLLDAFKRETMENIAKQDRGESVGRAYKSGTFRRDFKLFCFNYERWLDELKAEVPPHPWQQFRY